MHPLPCEIRHAILETESQNFVPICMPGVTPRRFFFYETVSQKAENVGYLLILSRCSRTTAPFPARDMRPRSPARSSTSGITRGACCEMYRRASWGDATNPSISDHREFSFSIYAHVWAKVLRIAGILLVRK